MSWDGAWMSVSNSTVWGRVAVYSTLEELRRRMLCLRTSDWSVVRWNGHGLPFGGLVGRIRRQRTLACTLVNDRRVSCGRAGTALIQWSCQSVATSEIVVTSRISIARTSRPTVALPRSQLHSKVPNRLIASHAPITSTSYSRFSAGVRITSFPVRSRYCGLSQSDQALGGTVYWT